MASSKVSQHGLALSKFGPEACGSGLTCADVFDQKGCGSVGMGAPLDPKRLTGLRGPDFRFVTAIMRSAINFGYMVLRHDDISFLGSGFLRSRAVCQKMSGSRGGHSGTAPQGRSGR